MIFYDRHNLEMSKETMSETKSEKLIDRHNVTDTSIEYEIDPESDENVNDTDSYDDDAAESRIIDDYQEGRNLH